MNPLISDTPTTTNAVEMNVNPLLRLYEQSFTLQLTILSSRWAGPDLLLKFTGTSTLDTYYPAHPFTNERSYRDFERLLTYIERQYPTNLLPALPSVPSASAKATERPFLHSFELFLQRLLSHPVFASDPILIAFCLSPATFDPPSAALETIDGGVRVPSPTWSDKLKALVTSGPKDTDVEFERRKEKCLELDFCFRSLTRSADKLASCHKELASALADVSIKASALGAAEPNAVLASDWHCFGKCMQSSAECVSDRATTESFVLNERVNLALKNCMHVQTALDKRLAILDAYDDACKGTEKHKRKMDKLRLGRPSEAKVGEALGKLETIKVEENTLRAQFRTASDLLARDWPGAEVARVMDMHDMVMQWAGVEHESERRLLVDVWTKLRSSLSPAQIKFGGSTNLF